MSAAEAAPPAKSKKKLIMIVAVAVLVLGGGGAAALVLMKKKAQAAEGEEHGDAPAAVAHDPKAVPVFVPLDPFTVNLADRTAERFAQIGITLELADPKLGDQIKAYMPAIRNNILLAIADRTADDLAGREGKDKLAERLKRETSRALGYQVDAEVAPAAEETPAKDAKDAKPANRKKRPAPPPLPIRAVHFSNFIIQ